MRKNFNNKQKKQFINELLNIHVENHEENVAVEVKEPIFHEYGIIKIDGYFYNLIEETEVALSNATNVKDIIDETFFLSKEDRKNVTSKIVEFAIEKRNKKLACDILSCNAFDIDYDSIKYFELKDIINEYDYDSDTFYNDVEEEEGSFSLQFSTVKNYFDNSINLIDIKLSHCKQVYFYLNEVYTASLYYGSLDYANHLSVRNVKNSEYNWSSNSYSTLPKFFLKECHELMSSGILYEIISILEDITNVIGDDYLNFKYNDIYELLEQVKEYRDSINKTDDELHIEDELYDLQDKLLYA